jgi:hypothetical protein
LRDFKYTNLLHVRQNIFIVLLRLGGSRGFR